MTEDSVSTASGEFKLSITRALADQLLDKLGSLNPAPLTSDNLAALQPRPGVYELFLRRDDGNVDRVYVGKASKDLPSRLSKHHRKLGGRARINLTDVLFQCLYVDEDLEAAAPEKMLINRYHTNSVIPWNTNGFGNNDPGRRRDHSLVKANHFDALHPINLDFALDEGIIPPGSYDLQTFLKAAKAALPFNLRYEERTSRAKHYSRHTVRVPADALTARELVLIAVEALPEGWQATALPGYAILYHETDTYLSARYLWRKEAGRVHETAGPNQRDEDGEVADDDEAHD